MTTATRRLLSSIALAVAVAAGVGGTATVASAAPAPNAVASHGSHHGTRHAVHHVARDAHTVRPLDGGGDWWWT